MASDDELVIDVSNLQMQYGDTLVLEDVTFQAKKGEVIVLLGPNGAGKTTTIEILEGFRMSSGVIFGCSVLIRPKGVKSGVRG